MTGFQDLSNELMLRILHFLQPRHIESIARTFNKRMTQLCLPFLSQRIRAARNDRLMRQLFGNPNLPEVDQSDYQDFSSSKRAYSAPEDPGQHLEYLRLDGSLDWLMPLDGNSSEAFEEGIEGAGIQEGESPEEFRKKMQQLGIEHALPEAFWKMMMDEDLMTRIPSASASFFMLPPLCRILSKDLIELHRKRRGELALGEDEIERLKQLRAYLLTFCSDQQGCEYWVLYVDSDGHHCVLYSAFQMDLLHVEDDDDARDKSLSEEEKCLGVQVAYCSDCEGLSLEATDFETWLAYSYFSQQVRFLSLHSSMFSIDHKRDCIPGEDVKVPEKVQEFLANVFTKEGREQQLRS